jgi:hypothetical protein
MNLLRHLNKVSALIFHLTASFLLVEFHCTIPGFTVKFILTLPVHRFLTVVRGKLMHCLCPFNPVMWASFQGVKWSTLLT